MLRHITLRKINNKLFDKKIAPACEYCEHGYDSAEYNMTMCKKHGVVSPYFRCKQFKYNPLRRKPKRTETQLFTPEEFSL